jgi:hypothetical protein
MGGGVSVESTAAQLEEHLKTLCGEAPVTGGDQANFWFSLLTIPHSVVAKNTEHFAKLMKKSLRSFGTIATP